MTLLLCSLYDLNPYNILISFLAFTCIAKPALIQNRFSIKTGFASSIEATKLDLSQNGSIQNLFSIKY